MRLRELFLRFKVGYTDLPLVFKVELMPALGILLYFNVTWIEILIKPLAVMGNICEINQKSYEAVKEINLV